MASSSSASFQFPTRSYRPLQCPTCKGLLLNPVTLPCGFSVCQACLPPLQTIDYQQQIKCPFRACSRSTLHTPDQLHIDVTLQNLTTTLRTAVQQSSSLANIISEDSESVKPHRQPDTLYYGTTSSDPSWNATLEGLYDPYEAVPAAQSSPSPSSKQSGAADNIPSSVFYNHLGPILEIVRPKIQQEIECQICFLVFDHPITTECGHTLCKSCLITSLDHKPSCALCRRKLPLYMHYHNQAPNKALVRFIQYLAATYPPQPEDKDEAVATAAAGLTATITTTTGEVPREEREVDRALSMTPLFINSLVFPKMPCYLLVFEPRYRRLLRNVLKTQSRLFGMVLPPPQPKKHRDLDCTAWEPSMEYGTLLKVISCELLPDGRALVETVGISRFQILTYSKMDDYFAATAVELIHDLPAEHELGLENEALEAAAARELVAQWNRATELAASGSSESDASGSNSTGRKRNGSIDGSQDKPRHESENRSTTGTGSSMMRRFSSVEEAESAKDVTVLDLDREHLEGLSRKQLMDMIMMFVIDMQDRLGALTTQRLQREFGEVIEDDGQYFSFWVASVLPVRSYQKYHLLRETSVRRRLLTVLGWIRDIETRRAPMSVCTLS
ncbi:PUA-like domain-containing protein [Mortierella sp. GBAus27b]|nr:PUA-like domain-containing protein [Mortierella sp. GBAus27b]